jgi:ABC transporter substrate binding protein (PQQ-dependent alcohol dehydrogenase system)
MSLRLALAFALALVLSAAAPASHALNFKLLLLVPADDTRLERSRIERAVLGHPGGGALQGLQLALADGKFELDAAASRIDITTLEVSDEKAAAKAAQQSGFAAIVTDLPSTWTLAVANAAPLLPVLNVGNAADNLRQADCRKNLWHLLPSDRMRSDAVAQTLVARKWLNVLLLTSTAPEDSARNAAALASIKRYGLKLAASKPYKLSADPRERDLANPLLLTGASVGAYDVVWVVDGDGEFASLLPYRTAQPRPVVGDGGLLAIGWSSKFERYGAPQVSRSFAKQHQRAMTAQDWSAWMAGKAAVAAVVAAKGNTDAFTKALPTVQLDGSKGTPLAFRPWDGQLRQPLLLTDGQSVITTAPVDGVLHPKNNLDTLGADAPEKLCKARL